MIIKLLIDSKEKTFSTTFVKARIFRRVLDMNEKMDFNKLSTGDLDEMVALICETFNDQFTVNEFYDGLNVTELIPTITNVFEYVAGSANRDDTGKPQPMKS